MHITQYGRRLKMTLLSGMTVACLACIVAVPFFEKNILKNEVGYFSIRFNGEEVACANTREEAEDALAAARLRFSKENDSIVYMTDSIDIQEEYKLLSKRMDKTEIEDALYETLFECVSDKENATAYTLRMDDFTVTLSSRDEIVELIERVTAKVDVNNEFQVKIATGEGSYGKYSVELVKSDVENTSTNIVALALNGESSLSDEEVASLADGIVGIGFEESLSISETMYNSSDVLTVDEAYEAITKEKAEKTMYEVVAGDCLSKIASKCDITLSELYSLNDGLTETSLILPGDLLVVTVPKAELSVSVTKRVTYEEDYEAEVEYVDDNKNYRGFSRVVDKGSAGHHKVVSDITYINGVKQSETYIEETIMVEAQPKVVALGTLTPPTFLKPIDGGRYSSGYGMRDGRMHHGTDWACPTGTKIYAAAAGTVIRSGWYSGYGYCVDIRHKDGSMTRYGHCSKLVATVGQKVDQRQLIAYSGNTGNSSGPHIHFEIWINGSTVNALNYVNKY